MEMQKKKENSENITILMQLLYLALNNLTR